MIHKGSPIQLGEPYVFTAKQQQKIPLIILPYQKKSLNLHPLSETTLLERCRSGRSGRSRKPLYPYGYPGFESLSFRNKAALRLLFAFKDRDENPRVRYRFSTFGAKRRKNPVFPQPRAASDKLVALVIYYIFPNVHPALPRVRLL